MTRINRNRPPGDSVHGVLEKLRLHPTIETGYKTYEKIRANGTAANRKLTRKKDKALRTLKELVDGPSGVLHEADRLLIDQITKVITTANHVEPRVLANATHVGTHLVEAAKAARLIDNAQGRQAIDSLIDDAVATFITASIKQAISESATKVANGPRETENISKEAHKLRSAAFNSKFGINHMIQSAASSDGAALLRATLNWSLEQWIKALIDRTATPGARLKREALIKTARRVTQFGHTATDMRNLSIAMDFALIETAYTKVLLNQGTHHAARLLSMIADEHAKTASIDALGLVRRHGVNLPAPHGPIRTVPDDGPSARTSLARASSTRVSPSRPTSNGTGRGL